MRTVTEYKIVVTGLIGVHSLVYNSTWMYYNNYHLSSEDGSFNDKLNSCRQF